MAFDQGESIVLTSSPQADIFLNEKSQFNCLKFYYDKGEVHTTVIRLHTGNVVVGGKSCELIVLSPDLAFIRRIPLDG